MSAGIPLTDADRLPWLRRIAADHRRLAGARRIGRGHLLGAEAVLPRHHHRRSAGRALVYLKGSPDLIRQRMAARHGHFMPPTLLDSQFAILEEPSPDENPIVVDIGGHAAGDRPRNRMPVAEV